MAFYIKQNDTSPSLSATLTDYNGNAVNLTGASAKMHMKDQGGTLKVNAAMTVTDADAGIIKYDWQSGDTDTVGSYNVEFQVTYSDSSIETFPNHGYEVVVVVGELN